MAEHVAWPSFDNYSVAFARRLLERSNNFALCATIIQRWWRKQPISPLISGGKEVSATVVCSRARRSRQGLNLDEIVCATEKLDGTNVGVRDDGRLMGRRHLLPEGTLRYQSTSVSHVASAEQVSDVRNIVERAISLPASLTLRVILYGELICTSRYDYHSRKLVADWRCFGARVWVQKKGEENEEDEEVEVEEEGMDAKGAPKVSSNDSRGSKSSSCSRSNDSSNSNSSGRRSDIDTKSGETVVVDEGYFDSMSPRRAAKGNENEGEKNVVLQHDISSSKGISGSSSCCVSTFEQLFCCADTCFESALSVCSCCCLALCTRCMSTHFDSKGLFSSSLSSKEAEEEESSRCNVSARLIRVGLWVAGGENQSYKHGDKITLLFSPNFQKLLESQNISKVPIVASAPLRELVVQLLPRMMTSDWEGVVLVGNRTLHKWKTGMEDESWGRVELAKALALPAWMLHPAEIEVGKLLLQVASNRPEPTEMTVKRGVKVKPAHPFSREQLKRAYDSALTKYDSMEVYYARGVNEMKDITLKLAKELVDDLKAETSLEIGCVENYAKHEIGVSYGKWIQDQRK